MKKLEIRDLEKIAGAYTAKQMPAAGTETIVVKDGDRFWVF